MAERPSPSCGAGNCQFELPAFGFAFLVAGAGRSGSALAPLVRARLPCAATFLGAVVLVAVSIALVVCHCRNLPEWRIVAVIYWDRMSKLSAPPETGVPIIGSRSRKDIFWLRGTF